MAKKVGRCRMVLAMLKGLDVSSYQGVVNWPSVVAMGCRFAFIKCSEGNKGRDPIFDIPTFNVDRRRAANVSGRDPQFDANVDGARAAGLRIAPYHFAYPLPDQVGNPLRSPANQAKFAFDCAEGLGSNDGELPPMLDLEWPTPENWTKWGCSADQIKTWAKEYLTAATGFWGCRPILYTYPYFWGKLEAAADDFFKDFPLCIASYPDATQWPIEGEHPVLPKPWDHWTFWQFTGGGMKLPNGTPCDFEVFAFGEAELKALCATS